MGGTIEREGKKESYLDECKNGKRRQDNQGA